MKFKLEIELGNDAMQRKVDIETALQSVARKFHEAGKAKLGDEGFIKDENGNTVGKFEVVDARGFRHSNKLVFRDEENYESKPIELIVDGVKRNSADFFAPREFNVNRLPRK